MGERGCPEIYFSVLLIQEKKYSGGGGRGEGGGVKHPPFDATCTPESRID